MMIIIIIKKEIVGDASHVCCLTQEDGVKCEFVMPKSTHKLETLRKTFCWESRRTKLQHAFQTTIIQPIHLLIVLCASLFIHLAGFSISWSYTHTHSARLAAHIFPCTNTTLNVFRFTYTLTRAFGIDDRVWCTVKRHGKYCKYEARVFHPELRGVWNGGGGAPCTVKRLHSGAKCGCKIWWRSVFGIFDLDNAAHDFISSPHQTLSPCAFPFRKCGRLSTRVKHSLRLRFEFFSVGINLSQRRVLLAED